jgi:tetratricopeptide (TPR) repeat protein
MPARGDRGRAAPLRPSDRDMPLTPRPAWRLELDAALQHLLASACFARSTRQQRFLRHLVSAALDGQAAALKESVLAIEVFGRSADRFDPTRDNIVRVEARRLRQRLARYYAGPGAAAAWEFALPVGSYVPVIRRRDGIRPPSCSRRARDLVERGDHFLRAGDFRAALDRYQEALRDCGDYAQAHLGAARAWVNLGMSGLEPSTPAVDHALETLNRALECDPSLPEAAALKGFLLHRFEHDWAGAERELKWAAEQAPDDARVHDLYGFQLVFAGLHDAAEAQLQRARELDPQNPAFRLHTAWLRMAQRRWADAEKEHDALLDIAPDNLWALLARADLMLYRGRHAEALVLYGEARRRCPAHADSRLGEACALFGLGRDPPANALLRAARAAAPPPSIYVQAEVMALRHRYEDALRLLRRSAAARDPLFLAGTTSPAFEPMYPDPRFQALYRSSRAVDLVAVDGLPPPS